MADFSLFSTRSASQAADGVGLGGGTVAGTEAGILVEDETGAAVTGRAGVIVNAGVGIGVAVGRAAGGGAAPGSGVSVTMAMDILQPVAVAKTQKVHSRVRNLLILEAAPRRQS